MQVPSFSLKQQLSEIGPEINSAISKVVESGQYIGGFEVEKFEKKKSSSSSILDGNFDSQVIDNIENQQYYNANEHSYECGA